MSPNPESQLWLNDSGDHAPTAGKFKPVRNRGSYAWGKPEAKTGFWTSTFVDGTSGWVEWMRSDWFDKLDKVQAAWLLEPSPDSRIWEIDGYGDLERLMRCFGTRAARQHEQAIDFEAMAESGWDGIHLTDEGQWQTRLSDPYNLYGWDCESTLWFRWCFGRVEPLPLTALDLTSPYDYEMADA